MRNLFIGIIGVAAAIGFGALAAGPAEAQPYYPGYRHGPPSVEYHERGYRPAFAPGRHRGYRDEYRGRRHGYYRQAFAGPRCFVRMEQAWNGWTWVRQPVRVCR